MKKLLSLFTALVLCTAMWGATYKTFYKVEGALYQGINVDFTTNKNMFVPNGASVTYTTFDGQPADWYNNGSLKKSGQSSYKVSNLADGGYCKYQITNYTGYDAQDPKIDYMYGTVDNKNYFLRAGSGTMYMMSMANAYCVCTEHATASNVGKYYVDNRSMLTLSSENAEKYSTSMKYGTDFSYSTHGAVIAYEMLVDNPGEMYIDYIVLPIFGYPKTDETTIAKMIPEKKKLTLTLYPIDLTLATDGKYSYTRKTPAITTVTATKENFNQGDKVYNGTVKFDLSNNPVLISGDFVARLTWDDDCNFGLITDNTNLQNYTTWYICNDGKYYIWKGGGSNSSISYHAMFPVLESKDESTELTIPSTGTTEETEKTISFKSNINPTFDDFTIEVSNDSWINMNIEKKNITYSGTTYKQSGTNTITFNVTAEPNTTGKTRKATITLKHHLKELTYTITQEPMPSAFYNLPEGAFGCGMTTTGKLYAPYIVAPYIHGKPYEWKSTTGAGKWTVGSKTVESSETYTMEVSMKEKYNIPVFEQEGKIKFQFGIKENEEVRTDSYFYVGNPTMQYITPALLYTDLASNLKGQSLFYLPLQNVMGVYFNNKDVMYIDHISIPIIYNESPNETDDDFFPQEDGSHIDVKIYHAKIEGETKQKDIDKPAIWTGTLTKNAFSPYDEKRNRGALNATFDPIPIEGPFVVELSGMKESSCAFRIFASKERSDCNKWGYCLDANDNEINQGYTPAISVHAMFPALYPKDDESLDVEIPAKGSTFGAADCPTRTVYANYKYETDKNGWSRKASVSNVITMKFYKDDQTDVSTKWYFIMDENKTREERKVDVTFTFRGKTLTYHVTQLAPAPDFTLPNKAAGAYATICLPGKIDNVENATLFHISHGNINKVEFEEVTDFTDEPAGMPYLVQVTEVGSIKFFYDKNVPEVVTPVTPENANGFVGSLQEAKQDVPDNGMSLLVSGGQLHLAAENCHLTKNHAYIDVNNVPASPNKAPNMAARRVTLYNPNAVPTNLNGLNGTVKPMKVLRDGQLYIIRDTKTYNAQGIELQ